MGWLLAVVLVLVALVVGVIVGVFLNGGVGVVVVVVRARAGGVNAREVMRCGVGRDAEVRMRGEYGRYCGLCVDDVGTVVRFHDDGDAVRVRDMNPSTGQSRAVVVRWHRRDPESNSRRCAEIRNSSFLGSTPSVVVDAHAPPNPGSSDEPTI